VANRDTASAARRSTRFAFLLLIAVMLALGGAGAYAAHRIYALANDRYVDRAAPIFASTQDLLVDMLDQETGVRGYVISGQASALQPYRLGRVGVRRDLAEIAASQSSGPNIPQHLAAARRAVARLERFYAHQIALVRSGPAGQRRAQDELLAGKAQFDRFRSVSFALETDAGNVVQEARHEQHSTFVTAVLFLAAVVLVGLLIAGALLVQIPARLHRLYRSEEEARRAAEEGAEASRALAHVTEAVVLLDEQETIRYWNPAAVELFGVGTGAAIGSPLVDVAPGAVDAVTALAPVQAELKGHDRWLAATETRFEGGRVVVIRDLTPDHELERMRSEFVATAAHELRTPLAAIYGAVRTIRRADHELPAETHEEFLTMIETESERLRYLVEQMLASAQLERQLVQLSLEECDLGELCRRIVETTAHRLPPSVTLEPSLPAEEITVAADPDRLRQAIENLLDNAVKYSPDGGRIVVDVRRRDGAGVVTVRDEGIGIPADEHARIFEKFYRLDPGMTRGVGGSGLGLYIIRELITQMGGEVEVQSVPGRGSTFTIALPLR